MAKEFAYRQVPADHSSQSLLFPRFSTLTIRIVTDVTGFDCFAIRSCGAALNSMPSRFTDRLDSSRLGDSDGPEEDAGRAKRNDR